MSEDLNPYLNSDTTEREEDSLTIDEEAAFRDGFAALPTPNLHPGFNFNVMATLTSGRSFDSLSHQMGTRLRWMLLPLAFGALTMLVLDRWLNHVENVLRTKTPLTQTRTAMSTPDLPSLPTNLLSTNESTLPEAWRHKQPVPTTTIAPTSSTSTEPKSSSPKMSPRQDPFAPWGATSRASATGEHPAVPRPARKEERR